MTATVEPDTQADADVATETADLLIEAEIAAEQLAAVLRMAVALGLALFFLLAVIPERDAVPDGPLRRQWLLAMSTMGAYFALGFGLWLMGRLGLLRAWMVWPTAAADCVFLLFNIWLGLDNTGMGGSATFLLPATWLIPIALAYGALRVNPNIQIFIGLIVLTGLSLMLPLVPEVPEVSANVLAEDFLQAPPNIMRLSMIALACAVLVVAARRTRRLLIRSIAQTRRAANLTRYLPAQLAPQLAEGGLAEMRRGRRQTVAILFVDVRGFTRFSETMRPEEVSSFVTEFRRRIAKAVVAHDGIIDKYLGDAAMILFSGNDDAERAASDCLGCIEAISSEMLQWSRDREAQGLRTIRVGQGAHIGPVFSGVVGDSNRLEFTVFGDAVNVAARLEAMTRDLDADVVVSRALLDIAGQSTEVWQPRGAMAVRGRDTALECLSRRTD